MVAQVVDMAELVPYQSSCPVVTFFCFCFVFGFRTTPNSIRIAEDGVVVRLDCYFGYRFDPVTFKFDSGSFEGF